MNGERQGQRQEYFGVTECYHVVILPFTHSFFYESKDRVFLGEVCIFEIGQHSLGCALFGSEFSKGEAGLVPQHVWRVPTKESGGT